MGAPESLYFLLVEQAWKVTYVGNSDPRGGGVNWVVNRFPFLGLKLVHRINLDLPTHAS
jgi:hypothetical protein